MRHFTVEQARAALADVRPLAERMVACARELRNTHELIDHSREAVAGNGRLDPAGYRDLLGKAERLRVELGHILERLEALGVQVKSLERGLVDFPAVHPRTGETVLLCWQVGEDDLRYWHGATEGFPGRKPLPF